MRATLVGSITGQDGNCNHGSTEANIKDDGYESNEGYPTQKAGKENCKGGVDDSSARYALDSFLPSWNMSIMSGKVGKIPGENPKDESRDEKLESVEEGGGAAVQKVEFRHDEMGMADGDGEEEGG